MFVADAHCDTLSMRTFNNAATPSVTPERLLAGGVGLQVFAAYAAKKDLEADPYGRAREMLDNRACLGVDLLTGRLPDVPPDRPTGVISLEGGEILEGSMARLYELDDEFRLRMIALTWNYENEIGHPAKLGDSPGLKPFGRELIGEMDARGILSDVSHLNEAGFWDVVELSALPPIASHSNAKELCPHFRNLTRRQIQAIIERGGFIGINFYSEFLSEGGADMGDVARHIDYIVQLGGINVVGFGSDFDGIDTWPDGLGDPSCFPVLIEKLMGMGYSGADVESIAGLNLWRVLVAAEAARKI